MCRLRIDEFTWSTPYQAGGIFYLCRRKKWENLFLALSRCQRHLSIFSGKAPMANDSTSPAPLRFFFCRKKISTRTQSSLLIELSVGPSRSWWCPLECLGKNCTFFDKFFDFKALKFVSSDLLQNWYVCDVHECSLRSFWDFLLLLLTPKYLFFLLCKRFFLDISSDYLDKNLNYFFDIFCCTVICMRY